MAYISQAKINCLAGVTFEIKSINGYSVLWVYGKYGIWFLKLDNNQYQIIQTLEKKLSIQPLGFYSLIKYYYASYYKYSTSKINAVLSLICVIIKRMFVGARVGFKKYLRVRGVGYKFELKNLLLTAKVGYTQLIKTQLPSEFYTKFSRKAKVIRFRSKSLTKLTGFLSQLKSLRRPDVYQGKGIRYRRDSVRRKPGKTKRRAVSKKKKFNIRKILRRRRRRKRRKKKSLLFFRLGKSKYK